MSPHNNPPAGSSDSAHLLDVRAVAKFFGCSARHVYRLVDDGRMPPPLRIGHLVRWPPAVIRAWVSAGCPPVQKPNVAPPKAGEAESFAMMPPAGSRVGRPCLE